MHSIVYSGWAGTGLDWTWNSSYGLTDLVEHTGTSFQALYKLPAAVWLHYHGLILDMPLKCCIYLIEACQG